MFIPCASVLLRQRVRLVRCDTPPPERLSSELDERRKVAERFSEADRPWLLIERAVEARQARPVPFFDPPRKKA